MTSTIGSVQVSDVIGAVLDNGAKDRVVPNLLLTHLDGNSLRDRS